MKDRFTHSDILRIMPWIKPRTLISWSERGLVEPAFEDAAGRGSRRLYSYKNVLEIAFCSELLGYGIPFHVIKNAIDEFRIVLQREIFGLTFIITNNVDRSRKKATRWIESGATRQDKIDPPNPRRDTKVMTSEILVHLSEIKYFIDAQIQEL